MRTRGHIFAGVAQHNLHRIFINRVKLIGKQKYKYNTTCKNARIDLYTHRKKIARVRLGKLMGELIGL